MLWAAWFCVCTPLVSTCFWLWVPWATWFCTCLPLFSHTCRQVAHRLTPTVSKYAAGALGRMSLRLSPVLHLSPSCLPLPGSALDRLSPSWLPGSPLSKKGVDALDLLILDYLPLTQCAVGALGRMTRAAGALGPMMLHLPSTCLPVCCGCSELHGSTLVPHLSCRSLFVAPVALWCCLCKTI